jgi:hypothetical protein
MIIFRNMLKYTLGLPVLIFITIIYVIGIVLMLFFESLILILSFILGLDKYDYEITLLILTLIIVIWQPIRRK